MTLLCQHPRRQLACSLRRDPRLLSQVPLSLILLAMRIAMGFVFFNAGLLKARSFDFAVKLFADEYRLPIIPPEFAARLAMTVELGAPLFLFAGLATGSPPCRSSP